MKIKWYKDKQLMNVNQKNGVTWLTYPAFEKIPGIVHGFSTRLGGVSQGIYESMNLSFTRGDNEDAVRENYRRLSDAMGFSMGDIVTSDQTHTTNVHVVTVVLLSQQKPDDTIEIDLDLGIWETNKCTISQRD